MSYIPILCYHRVCPVEEIGVDSRSLCVTPEQFRSQMSLLKWLGYHPISVPDMLAVLQGRKNHRCRSVVLTFDDGYADNYLQAFPILKKFSFPATVFLVTDQIGGKNVWDSGTLPMLNQSQIEEMTLGGIGFGSHTATHADLSVGKAAEVRVELSRSKKKVEAMTSRLDTSFCYPYSRLNDESKKLVRECGYICGFSGDKGVDDPTEDFFDLKRIQVFPATSLFGFWKKIQPWYPRWMKLQKKLKS